MTIVRLSGDRLVLIFPVKLNTATIMEINELGTVEYIVAPNLFHNLFIQACQDIFPEAIMIAVPELKTRIPL